MKFKIALAQTESCSDIKQNLLKAASMIREAAGNGASIIVFPETFLASFSPDATAPEKCSAAQAIEGEAVSAMREMAAQNGIWLVFGMYEPAYENDRGVSVHNKNYNTTIVADDLGRIRSIYHKTHLYDAFSYRESDFNVSGDGLFVPLDTPFGSIGLMVCYEVRFPEIARYEALKGAQVILMPTAWAQGEEKSAQLKNLVISRSIENTVYIAMCDMCGGGRIGESMVTDPMGRILARADGCEQILYADIDTDIISTVREIVPSLANRRPELYI